MTSSDKVGLSESVVSISSIDLCLVRLARWYRKASYLPLVIPRRDVFDDFFHWNVFREAFCIRAIL